METTEIKRLYSRFNAGLHWINQQRVICASGRRRTPNYELEAEISRFFDEVVEPMDELWGKMPEPERLAFEASIHRH